MLFCYDTGKARRRKIYETDEGEDECRSKNKQFVLPSLENSSLYDVFARDTNDIEGVREQKQKNNGFPISSPPLFTFNTAFCKNTFHVCIFEHILGENEFAAFADVLIYRTHTHTKFPTSNSN